jgi:transposase
MRLKTSVSKNSTSIYVIKSVTIGGKRTSKIVERLGTTAQIAAEHPGEDPFAWANARLAELNEANRRATKDVLVRLMPSKTIEKDETRLYRGGYLFLQQIYYELGLDAICKAVADTHKFTYSLCDVLACLVFGRILEPASKLATHQFSQTLLEPPSFGLQHVYRALEVMAKDMDLIQSKLYKNSKRVSERNDAILYYDCTNYFFEVEQEDGVKQYGHSKEHRPNPIVQMGLFMDGDGVPLAFSINPGNTNEQTTLRPLEKKILSDFGHAKFIVCTDAGLSSAANRRFNDTATRSFVTTQSIKQLKGYLKRWALDSKGWRLGGGEGVHDIAEIDEQAHATSVFYKERWIRDGGLDQRLVVTYSLKYKNYQRAIRARQAERAQRLIDSCPKKIGKAKQNDFKRLISTTVVTSDGEVAEKRLYAIDAAKIAEEEAYDGFYGVCTNLEDDSARIAEINRQRWQIEECFRIMKHEMKARPVFLSRDDRIKAHFLTCFIALMLYRTLEKRLDSKYSCSEIIEGLQKMNFLKIDGEGWIPTYTRTSLTDSLHEVFGFRTDSQIVTNKQMKRIFRATRR